MPAYDAFVTKAPIDESKRPYDLGKRLEQMDRSRAAILRAARAQLAANGARKLTMESLATESGVTRQTIHNLFGTKAGVIEALFDVIALEGGMEGMREVMTQPTNDGLLEGFVGVFCGFWSKDRLLLRRIHGIAAIDPELGAVVEARNSRRRMTATRIVGRLGGGGDAAQRTAMLHALTSFEFYDALAESCGSDAEAGALVLTLARRAVH